MEQSFNLYSHFGKQNTLFASNKTHPYKTRKLNIAQQVFISNLVLKYLNQKLPLDMWIFLKHFTVVEKTKKDREY